MIIYSIDNYLNKSTANYELIQPRHSILESTESMTDSWFIDNDGAPVLVLLNDGVISYYNITSNSGGISITKMVSSYGGDSISIDSYQTNSTIGNKAFVFSICYGKEKDRFVNLDGFTLEIVGRSLSVFDENMKFVKVYSF